MRIFPIDRPAGSCYNRFDSAKIPAAPSVAGFCEFVKRKNKFICGKILLDRMDFWRYPIWVERAGEGQAANESQ